MSMFTFYSCFLTSSAFFIFSHTVFIVTYQYARFFVCENKIVNKRDSVVAHSFHSFIDSWIKGHKVGHVQYVQLSDSFVQVLLQL